MYLQFFLRLSVPFAFCRNNTIFIFAVIVQKERAVHQPLDVDMSNPEENDDCLPQKDQGAAEQLSEHQSRAQIPQYNRNAEYNGTVQIVDMQVDEQLGADHGVDRQQQADGQQPAQQTRQWPRSAGVQPMASVNNNPQLPPHRNQEHMGCKRVNQLVNHSHFYDAGYQPSAGQQGYSNHGWTQDRPQEQQQWCQQPHCRMPPPSSMNAPNPSGPLMHGYPTSQHLTAQSHAAENPVSTVQQRPHVAIRIPPGHPMQSQFDADNDLSAGLAVANYSAALSHTATLKQQAPGATVAAVAPRPEYNKPRPAGTQYQGNNGSALHAGTYATRAGFDAFVRPQVLPEHAHNQQQRQQPYAAVNYPADSTGHYKDAQDAGTNYYDCQDVAPASTGSVVAAQHASGHGTGTSHRGRGRQGNKPRTAGTTARAGGGGGSAGGGRRGNGGKQRQRTAAVVNQAPAVQGPVDPFGGRNNWE